VYKIQSSPKLIYLLPCFKGTSPVKVKIKLSRYRPGQALGFPGD
jgi:hypothetical protein